MKARLWLTVAFLLLSAVLPVGAQLAITEVMSEASTTDRTFKGQDFWELTNFGTNTIYLHGYGFSDSDTNTINTNALMNLIIGPGESIIFFRSNRLGQSAEQFRAWWGTGKLAANLQIHFYITPGLDGDSGDSLWLRDPSNVVVAKVQFGEATPGRTFVYDPDTGEFGQLSRRGEDCAFQAARTDDIGSPGCTTGPIDLGIDEQPASQVLAGCGRAILRVRARGMPPPKYQWFCDGEAIEGATEAVLELPEVRTSGTYHVVLNNGLQEVTTMPAELTIDSRPRAPVLVSAPEDVVLFPEQTAFFSVEARGYSCVSYQWQTNGVDLPGETASSVRIDIPWDAPHGTQRCCVRIYNEVGSTNVCANLQITHRPHLQITEVMSLPSNHLYSVHKDWFELINGETNAVDLKGYRFRSFKEGTSINVAWVIPEHLIIGPGECVIFVEHMTTAEFAQWWGRQNLSAGLKVVTWHGWAIDDGEVLYLWNPAAVYSHTESGTNEVSNASFADTGEGVSKELINYCGDYGCTALGLTDSVLDVNGAFRATETGDVGSPGFYERPVLLQIAREPAQVRLRARVRENRSYQLAYKATLSAPSWTPLSTYSSSGSLLQMEDETAGADAVRFYRLEELP